MIRASAIFLNAALAGFVPLHRLAHPHIDRKGETYAFRWLRYIEAARLSKPVSEVKKGCPAVSQKRVNEELKGAVRVP
ncbi:MAG: hypothetical protein DFNUSKGM_001399 [Candidatus Fervidibacter sacchari]